MPRLICPEWKPDQPEHLNDGLVICDGVTAIANGYQPINSFVAVSNGDLGATPIGGAAYRVGASTYVFAATTTNIYRYQAAGFTSLVSALTGSTSIGVRFQPYNTLMLATNGVDPIKKFDPTAPTTMTNLGGTPPTARFIAVVRGFVVLGYAAGDSLRLAWSDNGVPTTWTAGTGEAGFYQMPSGGDITAVVGGEYGLIFQENRILRMTYTADDTIWQFDEIASDVGCIAPNSIATYGKTTFFVSNRGIMSTDGVTVTPIGEEKVNRTFNALFNRAYLENMTAVIDPKNSIYYLAVPTSNPISLTWTYNYSLQKWTSARFATKLLFPALAQGVTLEDLDALYPSGLDFMPLSLDSAAFRGGTPLMLVFDGANKLGSLSGLPIAAEIQFASSEIIPGRKTRIRSVRPMTDAPNVTLTISGSAKLSNTQTNDVYTVRQGDSGLFRTRSNFNISQFDMMFPAGQAWTNVQGLDFDVVDGGGI